MIDFVKEIVDDLDVSPRGVQVGLIGYGSKPTIVFPFIGDSDEIKKLADSTVAQPGIPRIDLALELANQKLFTPANGARKEAAKVFNQTILRHKVQNPNLSLAKLN